MLHWFILITHPMLALQNSLVSCALWLPQVMLWSFECIMIWRIPMLPWPFESNFVANHSNYPSQLTTIVMTNVLNSYMQFVFTCLFVGTQIHFGPSFDIIIYKFQVWLRFVVTNLTQTPTFEWCEEDFVLENMCQNNTWTMICLE